MELRQLVYFEAVARCGGFSRAGEELRIAQPAVSAQIRRLEAELGTTLLRRTTRRVELTQAGALFLTRVRQLIELLDTTRAELDELVAALRGQVRIGATPILGSLDLPAAMAAFHRAHPKVTFALRTGLLAELCAALDADQVDVVLGPVHAELPPAYVARQLREESLVLVTPPGQRPASDRPPTLASFRGERFVCLPRGSGLHAILTAAAAERGFVPRIDFEADKPASVREFVAAGLGVALLAESVACGPGPLVDVHRLADAPPHPPIGCILARERGASPAVKAFLAQLAMPRSQETVAADKLSSPGKATGARS